MKKLIYIFIPILAILLMSHNTSAINLGENVSFVNSWNNTRMLCAAYGGSNITFNSNTCVLNSPSYTGLTGDGLSFIQTSDVNLVYGDYYQVFLDVSASSGAETNIPVIWNLNTTGNFLIVDFEQVNLNNNLGSSANSEAYISSYRIILKSLVNSSSFPIELGYPNHNARLLYIAGDNGNLTVDVRITQIIQFSSKSDDQQAVVDAINDQTEKEENAANDIENQSTDDIDTGDDSSATNLIGNISTLFNQIGSIEASSSCSVPADFGNLDLGNINFCTGKDKLPFVVTFGAYAFELIFVVGTAIILVKQVLGLFDWARA